MQKGRDWLLRCKQGNHPKFLTKAELRTARDRKFVSALKSRDKDYLTSIPLKGLQSGTSELKSWISLAGLLEGASAEVHEIDYVPCYRSPAGTGTANGFYWWDMKGR